MERVQVGLGKGSLDMHVNNIQSVEASMMLLRWVTRHDVLPVLEEVQPFAFFLLF